MPPRDVPCVSMMTAHAGFYLGDPSSGTFCPDGSARLRGWALIPGCVNISTPFALGPVTVRYVSTTPAVDAGWNRVLRVPIRLSTGVLELSTDTNDRVVVRTGLPRVGIMVLGMRFGGSEVDEHGIELDGSAYVEVCVTDETKQEAGYLMVNDPTVTP